MLSLAVNCSGTRPMGPQDATVDRVEHALREFFQAAFYPDGDFDSAYSLLSTSSKASCSQADFEAMALVGRQALVSREPDLDIERVEVSGNEARAEISVSVGSFTTPFFPPDVFLVEEGGQWRYDIRTDPTCRDSAAFFDLRERPGIVPGVVVTPVYLENPDCDRSYPLFCIPSPPPYLTCSDLGTDPFPVDPPDPHGFDKDGDGFGCEEETRN